MNLAVGFDHRGSAFGATVIVELMSYGHTVLDLGIATAHDVASAILAGRAERGVVVSSSGVGASFVANKVDGIRAGAPTDTYGALHAVEDGMNLLCIGAGTVDESQAAEILAAFVSDETSGAPPRYERLYSPSTRTPEKV
jgi:ribose 5-phosphate isomerase B